MLRNFHNNNIIQYFGLFLGIFLPIFKQSEIPDDRFDLILIIHLFLNAFTVSQVIKANVTMLRGKVIKVQNSIFFCHFGKAKYKENNILKYPSHSSKKSGFINQHLIFPLQN